RVVPVVLPSSARHAGAPPSPFYPLSLHDALPIWPARTSSPSTAASRSMRPDVRGDISPTRAGSNSTCPGTVAPPSTSAGTDRIRSEEHTSELQSRENLVCRLLLEKKNPIAQEGVD